MIHSNQEMKMFDLTNTHKLMSKGLQVCRFADTAGDTGGGQAGEQTNTDAAADELHAAAAAGTDQAGQENVPNAASPSPGWMAQLPDNLKGNEKLARYKNVNELSTALLDLDGKSVNAVPLLTEDATDEEKAAFYKALGRPESPDGYTLEKPELPDGMVYDENLEAFMRPKLHEAGFSQAHFSAAADLLTAYNTHVHQQNVAATQKAMNEYVESVGADQAKADFEDVSRVCEKLGGNDLANLMERAEIDGVKLGNHPIFVKAFLGVKGAVLDDTYVGGGNPSKEINVDLTYE